ncbi:acetyltransferase [Bacteroidia bacterium]|nr:acetyltransferase [Bacteroidia bacterium]
MRIRKFVRRILKLPSQIYYSLIFKAYSYSSNINKPLRIDGAENIEIGKNVLIEYKTWLAAVPHTGADKCLLKFGDGCCIGHFNHIYATKSIVLEKNVLTADKVYISDNLHGYEDITTPISKQPIVQNGEVVIGAGSWLGESVCVLGAKIGKHCVIGANSVVTKDIPDYCVAVGAPARVVKKYNFETQEWEKQI